MISLKEFASALRPSVRLVIDDCHKVIEMTAGDVWFELSTTGRDFAIDGIEPKKDRVLLTVEEEA